MSYKILIVFMSKKANTSDDTHFWQFYKKCLFDSQLISSQTCVTKQENKYHSSKFFNQFLCFLYTKGGGLDPIKFSHDTCRASFQECTTCINIWAW